MHIAPRLLIVALAILAGSALAGCGGDEQASDQQAATFKGDGFTVAMPGKPTRQVVTATTPAGPVPITAYITEGGTEGYSLSVLKVPGGVKGDLEGAVQGAAASVQGKLASARKTTYQGFPARDARITGAQDTSGNKGTVFARVILARGKVFQLQFVTDGADVKSAPAQYTTFVASLKIL